jgi:hypothetical protein
MQLFFCPRYSQLIVEYPGGKRFGFTTNVLDVGKTTGGPYTLDPGRCVTYEPFAPFPE